VTKVTALDIATELGHSADYYGVMVSRMISGLTEAQEGWAWAVGICYYNGGGGASDIHALYYCAHTRDAWGTIHSCVEIETQTYGGTSIHLYSNLQFGIAQDLHTGYLFVAIGRWKIPGHVLYLTLYRSPDNGTTWDQAHQDTTWDFWSGGSTGFPSTITDVWIPYKNDWFAGGTVFWSGCCLQWDTGTDRPHPGRIYKSTANGVAAVRLDTDGDALAENDPEQAPTRLIGPYNGADYVWAISALDNAMGHGYDPAIYKWESGVGWSEWGSVADDAAANSPAGWVRQSTPDMYGVQLPTVIGWHTEPYETDALGDEDKGNRTAVWILAVEY